MRVTAEARRSQRGVEGAEDAEDAEDAEEKQCALCADAPGEMWLCHFPRFPRGTGAARRRPWGAQYVIVPLITRMPVAGVVPMFSMPSIEPLPAAFL